MKKLLLLVGLLTLAIGLQAQVLLNQLGFENGNIANWNQFQGTCCPISVTPGTVQGNLVSGTATDFYGGFSQRCPNGGNFSFKLGDSIGTNTADIIRYTFTVDTFNYYLHLNYAAVVKHGGIAATDDARFYMRVMDNNGTDIYNSTNCAACQFTPGVGAYQQSTVDPTVYYLPWTDQFVNLRHYSGQTVTIEVTAADANIGSSNFGYGYFDLVATGNLNPVEHYCIGATQINLQQALGAFNQITWYDHNFSLLGAASPLSLPVGTQTTGDSIYVVYQATNGQGINDTILYNIKLFPHPYPTANFTIGAICSGSPIQFTDVSTSTEPLATWNWIFGDPGSGALNGSTVQSPTHTYASTGAVTVDLIVATAFGCADTVQNTMSIQAPPVANAGLDTNACTNQVIVLGANPVASGGSGNFTYTWSISTAGAGSFINAQLEHPTALFNNATTVRVLITDLNTNCTSVDSLQFSLSVNCSNHSPSAATDNAIAGSGQQIAIAALANDADADGNLQPQGNLTTASLTILNAPAQGTAVINGTAVNYSANAGYVGLDSFSYVLHDNGTPDLMDTAMVYINCLTAVQANAGADQTLCNGTIGVMNGALASGGSGVYTYAWSPANGLSCTTCPNPIVSPSTSTLYQLIVTDATSLQQDTDFIQITIATAQVSLGNDTALNFNNSGVQLNAVYTGSSSVINYNWTPTVSCGSCANPLVAPFGFTTYTVNIIDANGCTATDSVTVYACSSDCIWPGDANHDHVSNFTDLLAIGLGYGYSGPIRFNPSLNWIGQPGLDWNTFTNPGLNFKHADGNADGLVNGLDTVLILNNYDSTHAKLGPPKSGTAPIAVQFSQATANNGDHIYANIVLGNASLPVDSVYGLAFTFNYDTTVVDINTVRLNRINGNFICTPYTDGMDMTRYPTPGKINYALTRINHLNKSGNGPVGRVDMDIQTGNIAGRTNQQYFYNLIASVSGVVVVDRHGDTINLNPMPDTCVIGYFKVGTNTIDWNAGIQVMPNPVTTVLYLKTQKQIHIESAQVIDLTGRKLLYKTWPSTSTNYTMDLEALQSGSYLVELNTNYGKTVRTIVIVR